MSGLPAGESRLKQSSTTREFADLLPDTSQYFEVWLDGLKPKPEPNTSHPQPGQLTVAKQPTPGEFRFEGTLRVDGYASGSLRSLTGTLIVGESGEVESNLIVATAIVDGFLRGDIYATERVELCGNARVFGSIRSPALSIQSGAVFEGSAIFFHLLTRQRTRTRDKYDPAVRCFPCTQLKILRTLTMKPVKKK